jgi:hypothetical protein
MATQKKVQLPWLMASALLGLPRLRKLMERHRLTLGQAERYLREEVSVCLCQEELELPKSLSEARIPWALAELGSPLNLGLSLFDEDEAEELMNNVLREEEKREKKWRKKAGSNRHLFSWLLDVGSERGDKLNIALGLESKTKDDAWKVRVQLERDSKSVLDTLEILKLDPLKARRSKSKNNKVIALAKLSLEQQDKQEIQQHHNYELDRLLTEACKLEEKLEKVRAEIIQIESGLKRLAGQSRKSGKQSSS